MEEQKSNFLEIPDNANPTGNIFNELSWELGELDFGEKAEKKQEGKKRDVLSLVYNWSSVIFTLTIIWSVIITADTFIRSAPDNSYFSSLPPPVCEYLSFGIDGYDNTGCRTLPMILGTVSSAKEKLENKIIDNLVIFVPKKTQSTDIINSPKVQFILKHTTADMRVPITDVINKFLEIKKRTIYDGKDISCKNFTIDETWKMALSCDVMGWALVGNIWWDEKETSRQVMLKFLNNFIDHKNGFRILSYPKSLEMSQYTSTDLGLTAAFSTISSIDLKLQYLPINKM